MLDQKQRELFEQQGYLVIENVFDQQSVLDPVREEYSALLNQLYQKWFDEGAVSVSPTGLNFWEKLLFAYQAGCDWFQPMDISLPGDRISADTPMHFGPAIFNLVTHNQLLDLVENLIGPEITSNPIQHVRIKPPASGLHGDELRPHVSSTDWHQDRGVALEEADKTDMITVWCAITDATVENGCLQVIPTPTPGSAPLLPHCPQRQTAIADGFIDISKALPLPVKSGGVVIFHPNTPHASLENNTDGFRWSFDLRFNVTGQPTGRSHFPEFIARSSACPENELRSSGDWRKLWEQARTRLSTNPHIDIHRWSSDAPVCA